MLLLIACAKHIHGADGALKRPVASAGESSRTLIVFTAQRSAFSLGAELEHLRLHLQRVATKVEAVPLENANSNDIASVDYAVFFNPTPSEWPESSTAALRAFAARTGPSLWVGHLPAKVETFSFSKIELGTSAAAQLIAASYRGRTWPLRDQGCIPIRLAPDNEAEVLISGSEATNGPPLPVALRTQNLMLFSALPGSGPLGALFSDLVLDFYGVTNSPSSRLLLRIDDYQATSNHREFRRVVDYLHSRKIPFALSATPSWQTATGTVANLNSSPAFVRGLRYAQQRGGRIVLRGLVRSDSSKPEFWDAELDRPLPTGATFPRRLHEAVHLLLQHGLIPLAWQTPQDSAPRAVYEQVGRTLSTAIERVQLSDLAAADKGTPVALTSDRYGRMVVPENIGYPLMGDTNSVKQLLQRAEFFAQLRGTIAGCAMHTYQPFEKWVELVQSLEGLKTPFLDLAEMEHWVQTANALVLTGNTRRSVNVPSGTLTWKGYERTGRLVVAEHERTTAGEREIRRRGVGDYEVFEFTDEGGNR